MPKWRFSELGRSFFTFLIGSVSSVALAGTDVAGTVGAVNNGANGTPPGGGSRSLGVGDSVVQNERVQTDTTGTAHIMFKDRSALNVGRNSSVVIDKFTYNPDAGASQQAISLVRGAMRFVGGQVSHSSEATVKTPAATIGIRGGNVTIVMQANGQAAVMVHNGVAIIANGFGSVTVRTGFQLIVVPSMPLGEPTRITLEFLREATRRLASAGGQTGGAHRRPTDSDAARFGLGTQRAPSPQSPNVDLPVAGDNLVHGQATTKKVPLIYRP